MKQHVDSRTIVSVRRVWRYQNIFQRVGLVQSGYHYHLIKFNLLSPWFNVKIAHLALNNNRSLILYLTNEWLAFVKHYMNRYVIDRRIKLVFQFTSVPYIHRYMFESRLYRGVLDKTLCDKACQWLAAGRWFSLGTPISPTNKTDRHDITEILLNVVLNTINLNLIHVKLELYFDFLQIILGRLNFLKIMFSSSLQ